MNLRTITRPAVEPITLEEALRHLEVDYGQHDSPPGDPATYYQADLVSELISAARAHAEDFTERCLAEGTFELRLDAFASVISLPKAPVQSIVSIMYIDSDGAEQTLDPAVYTFDDNPDAPAVRLAYDQTWPATRSEANAVRIRFVAGFQAASSPPNPVPPQIKQALLLIIGHLHENREDSSAAKLEPIPLGAQALLRPLRLHMGV